MAVAKLQNKTDPILFSFSRPIPSASLCHFFPIFIHSFRFLSVRSFGTRALSLTHLILFRVFPAVRKAVIYVNLCALIANNNNNNNDNGLTLIALKKSARASLPPVLPKSRPRAQLSFVQLGDKRNSLQWAMVLKKPLTRPRFFRSTVQLFLRTFLLQLLSRPLQTEADDFAAVVLRAFKRAHCQ